MEFRLLGAVEAHCAGRRVGLGPRQQRLVFAALALEVNRLVPVDRLIGLVWPESPPRTANHAIQVCVSRLRALIEGEDGVELVTRGSAYQLSAEPARIDAHRFRNLVEQARESTDSSRKIRLLEQALELWTGPPLAETADEPTRERLCRGLLETRMVAVEELFDAKLHLGQHQSVLGELTELVAVHPTREALACLLMLALYRSGQAGRALEVARSTRAHLAEELGIDPGTKLRQLELAMLRADPALELRPAAPVPPAPETQVPEPSRILGRAHELARLDATLDDVRAGATRVLEIIGEPGIGKTSLLEVLRARAARRGLTVLAGRAIEFQPVPFGVFIDALDDRLAEIEPDRLAPLGERRLELLASVFPALSGHDHRNPVAAERHLLHRAVRALLEVLGEGGVVLVLDDLHWSDDATAELVDHLLRHPPAVPLLMACAYRPRQVPARLQSVLAAADVEQLELAPLSAAEAARMCEQVPPWQLRRVYEASGGNPFYLDALARAAARGAATEPDGPLEDALPAPIRAALLGEFAGLPESSLLVARSAAVLGGTFEPDLLATVAEVGETEAGQGLDDLLARDLLRPDGSSRRFRFRHPLLRWVVYHGAGPGWRSGAHARAAHRLAELGAPLAVRATHVERSARIGDLAAVELLATAAEETMPIAPATAAHWLSECLRLLGGRAHERPALWLRLAHALAISGRLAESRAVLDEILAFLPTDAYEDRTRALTSLAMVERLHGRPSQVITLLQAEADRMGERTTSWATVLRLEAAAAPLRGNDFPLAVRHATGAVESARRSGEPLLVATADAMSALAHTFAGDAAGALASLEAAVVVIDAASDQELADHLESILRAGWTEVFLERYDAALRHLHRGLDLARRTGKSYTLPDLLVGIAFTHLWQGRLADTARYAEDALEAAQLVGSDELRTMAAAIRPTIAIWHGDFAGALRGSEKAVAEAGAATGRGPAVASGLLAQSRLFAGDPAGCVTTLLAAGGGDDLPAMEQPTRPLWYQVLTQAEINRGSLDAAAAWAERAEAAAAAMGLAGGRGHALLARASLSLAHNDLAASAHYADQAAAAFATAGMSLFEAQARMAAGSALAGSGDRPAAATRFATAEKLFSACGANELSALAAHLRDQ